MEEEKNEKKEGKRIKLSTFILVLIIMLLISIIVCFAIFSDSLKLLFNGNNNSNSTNSTTQITPTEEHLSADDETLAISSGLSNFDLKFLKDAKEKKNTIYSPLSIKYALKMLEEGATGEAKEQIAKYIADYDLTTYKSSKNLSLANSFFIKDAYKNNIKTDYINNLKSKYDAEIKFDSFTSPDAINKWIEEKTNGIIKNMLDQINPEQKFMLVNALSIDMEWNVKFLQKAFDSIDYSHEKFDAVSIAQTVKSHNFEDDKQKVSGMEIGAAINNYDNIKELGEENIRKTVEAEYRKYIQENNRNTSEAEIKEFIDDYIKSIGENYHRAQSFSEFSLYTDDTVKVFAKDLKEYDGTTLQYIGIMPTNESLDSFINNTDETKINNYLSNLKEIKTENFKEGVITRITGFIPKFKFEYELDLIESLKSLGIKDIFELGKANLTEISDDTSLYIDSAKHKANIEFTQDGIKAAAATVVGGLGAGGDFDYFYDVPVEEIDLTFDKPYMFIIRDKKTGETWFTGSVYEPLQWENEPEKELAERGY